MYEKLLFLMVSGLFAFSMEECQKEGKAWAKSHAGTPRFSAQDLNAKQEEGLDADTAQELARTGAIPQSEHLDFLIDKKVQNNQLKITEEEHFINRAEEITGGNICEVEQYTETTIETCRQKDAPFPLTVVRTLDIHLAHYPEESQDVKVCLGHEINEKFSQKEKARDYEKERHTYFSNNPAIQTYHISRYKSGMNWHVKTAWTHHEDVPDCLSYQTQHRVLKEASWKELSERWAPDDEAAFSQSMGPHCTLIEKTCLDSTPSKEINGKEVHRQCWKEKLTFLCEHTDNEECPFLKNSFCDLMKKECLSEGPLGCTLWQLTFKCYGKTQSKKVTTSEVFGLNDQAQYDPNESFVEVVSTLAVFDEIKKELEETQASDSRRVQVFKGKKMECRKSIAEDLTYDCCFSYAGLAKSLGLKNCNSDELALAEMRDQGLCHYVGKYKEKLLDLVKIGDTHVFCCFSSKLARVLHEQGRSQIGIDWQAPKEANCRGFSLDEIASLNFSKLDFSEVYSGGNTKAFDDKMAAFCKKVEEKARRESE